MVLDRLAKVVTPLGDSLLLHRLSGREELSRPFAYELVLLSADPHVKASSLLGQGVTVELELAEEKVRYFHGIVSRFARGGTLGRYAVYRASVRPWLWLLSRTSDCRIFQNTTVPDVIKQIFRDFGLTDFDDALSGSYRTWDYIAQYRETALAFVSRLMEQEGIYYYFRHESSKHTLVLADGYSAHATAPGYEEVPYIPPDEHNPRERDHLTDWTVSEQIQPGAYMLNDFDFVRPKANLQAKVSNPHDHASAELEYYDYPGEYGDASEGESYVKARLQALHAEYEQGAGEGNARGLSAGNLFKLSRFPLEDQNREYLIVATNHTIENSTRESNPEGEARVRASVEAIESRVQYRAAQLTPKPMISGPQTAIVVGKAGEEIWTDQHGRVKVQFHWDRLGKSDENSSCWVRVAQIWAGGRWGAMHIPRIGQEVIVEFLEGDPDRPIITGRVYNGDNKPPYDLPANQTQSGIKSRSTKGGSPNNFNELRFEDKKGEEHVYLQAEKDLQIYVKHDESRKVDNDRFKEVVKNEQTKVGIDRTEEVGGNETITIKKNRMETVLLDETTKVVGNRTDAVGKSEDVTIGINSTTKVGSSLSLNVGVSKTELVGVASALTIGAGYQVTVGGAMNQTVGGLMAEEVGAAKTTLVGGPSGETSGGPKSITAGGSIKLTTRKDFSVTATDDVQTSSLKKTTLKSKDDFQIDGAKKGMIQIKEQLTLKVGKATITLKKNGDIEIKGAKIKVNGSGDVMIKGSKVSKN
ncbi:MAG TPA: type VI secretion system tip protein TssI/VgrG [Polyangiales bacterium]|nr:type VI secretion system tip protein TssI/VgrG [Polyangiales bacterium]